MFKKLEIYLDEISRYLTTGKEKEEISSEIKSHILEKAEQEFGEITENSLERVIAAYGSPRQVAEKYMDDSQIIAPVFKSYLLRYTAMLFAIHFGLTILALISKSSMLIFPFFYIPRIDNFQAFFYFPMAFIYDLGLVGIVLYFVTQTRKDIKLPWPKLNLNWQKMAESRKEKPKIILLILRLLGYGALVWIYLRHHTLFFISANFREPKSLLNPEASKWYSFALLALLGIGIIAYIIKFFYYSGWITFLRSAFQLAILGVIINKPIENPFIEFTHFNLHISANVIVAIVAILIAIDFLKSLIILGKKPGTPNMMCL